MLQEERNYLFKVAYALDAKGRILDKDGNKFVVFTHDDCEKLAQDLRTLAERDGARVTDGSNKDNRPSTSKSPHK